MFAKCAYCTKHFLYKKMSNYFPLYKIILYIMHFVKNCQTLKMESSLGQTAPLFILLLLMKWRWAPWIFMQYIFCSIVCATVSKGGEKCSLFVFFCGNIPNGHGNFIKYYSFNGLQKFQLLRPFTSKWWHYYLKIAEVVHVCRTVNVYVLIELWSEWLSHFSFMNIILSFEKLCT